MVSDQFLVGINKFPLEDTSIFHHLQTNISISIVVLIIKLKECWQCFHYTQYEQDYESIC